MTARKLIGWIVVTVLAGVSAAPASASQPAATPFAVPRERHCVLDLDAPDVVIEMEIGEDVAADQHALIEWIVDSRVRALGINACSIDRFDSRLTIAMQTSLELTRGDFEALLAAPGRIELIDSSGDSLVAGQAVLTTGSPASGLGTPAAEPVYDVIISNADIVSIMPLLSEIGGPIAHFALTDDAHARLAPYTVDHIGETMPLVVDGVVIMAPTIRAQITDTFDLQPVDLEVTEKLAIYAAALPYPAPLTMTGFVDLRAN